MLKKQQTDVLITAKCYKNDQRRIFFRNYPGARAIFLCCVKKMSLAIRYDGRA
jgi:hypothetical protein